MKEFAQDCRFSGSKLHVLCNCFLRLLGAEKGLVCFHVWESQVKLALTKLCQHDIPVCFYCWHQEVGYSYEHSVQDMQKLNILQKQKT